MQRRFDDVAAVALLGRTEDVAGVRFQGSAANNFNVAGTVAGRSEYRLEYEIKPIGIQLDATGLGHVPPTGYADSGSPTLPTALISQGVLGLSATLAYQWRQRQNLAHPLFPRTTWRVTQGNGMREKKFGTALDCNSNGAADSVDISLGTSLDCNTNGVPDECDVAQGVSQDCNGNLVPDECDPDCNTNGQPDDCDIAGGFSLDTNQDGVPDDCQPMPLVFCPGDGTGTACPCGDTSTPGNGEGCLNSLGLAGRLRATGVARIAHDNFMLSGAQMPNSSALFFQGTAQAGSGNGTVFGDGLRCAAGSVIRLGTKINSGGSSSYPVPGDLPVSVKGAVPPGGGTRHYQVWYRNAASFCSAFTFNLTNGVRVTWVP
jgi:hypothetical protein